MQKLILILVSSLILSSCAIVHKMDIEQGNIITPEMTGKLHSGMSEAQVKDLMGTPVLLNTFDDSRVDYIYTYKKGNNPMTEQRVTLTFRNGILKNIQR